MAPFIDGVVTDSILRCAIAVHKELGPGLAEYSYQAALALEMQASDIRFVREQPIAARYKGIIVGWHRPDFVVENRVVVELKAVSHLEPVFTRQVLTYLRVSGLRVGLLLNFNVASLGTEGIRRCQL
ncbi:MAG TPA: GxxExxY protein [Vicinamibacterales bacterium]